MPKHSFSDSHHQAKKHRKGSKCTTRKCPFKGEFACILCKALSCRFHSHCVNLYRKKQMLKGTVCLDCLKSRLKKGDVVYHNKTPFDVETAIPVNGRVEFYCTCDFPDSYEYIGASESSDGSDEDLDLCSVPRCRGTATRGCVSCENRVCERDIHQAEIVLGKSEYLSWNPVCHQCYDKFRREGYKVKHRNVSIQGVSIQVCHCRR